VVAVVHLAVEKEAVEKEKAGVAQSVALTPKSNRTTCILMVIVEVLPAAGE
jgi:hypothetical protein